MARDYAKEYKASRTPKRRLANILRKRARRLMIKKHGEKAVQGKEIDHNHMLASMSTSQLSSTANRPSNLSIKSVHANRIKQPARR
ncbi:hypothetical protein [Bradyrhizobium sp. SZCCHNRI2049]|uniref:hypothetical protein n=1 Tax=Bradyrhizobium sp. SZCCHNRI2049 TaxID=3057287 RepID=UPI0029160413|nr:hypothetical protein [Bradyrhizobium sp. SZCCHNRI2049]